jgi:hypothetical protein
MIIHFGSKNSVTASFLQISSNYTTIISSHLDQSPSVDGRSGEICTTRFLPVWFRLK